MPKVRARLLEALLAHENAGGWIEHVISEIISTTREILDGNEEGEPLRGVVVDHSPGLGVLQRAILERIERDQKKDARAHQGVVVISPDRVDLEAVRAFATRSFFRDDEDEQPQVGQSTSVHWILNREDEESRLPQGFDCTDDWFRRRISIPHDQSVADANRDSQLLAHAQNEPRPRYREGLSALADQLFSKAAGS